MPWLCETVTDLDADADFLRRARYGVIDVQDGRVVAIHLRPWPKFASLLAVVFGQWYHSHVAGDRMRLYYNQPMGHSSFLALKFALSARNTSLATATKALEVLDAIARIKGSDALLLDAANFRLSDRMMARYGWEAHAPARWHRNYIKRFYPSYPRLFEAAEEPTLATPAPAIRAS